MKIAHFHEISQNYLNFTLFAENAFKSTNKPLATEAFERGQRKSAFWGENDEISSFS